jgi:ribosome-binding ATPase
MSLDIGIVGLPNVGKSTLFNALTDAGILVANYPFATIEPNTGVVPIPDPRIDLLAEMYGSKKTTPATVTFVDIAGLVRGASEGEGLGNKFLAKIRDVQAICHVVRAFQSPTVAHIGAQIDPASDIETIETELALADLQTIERHLPKLEKEAAVDRSLRPRLDLLQELAEHLGDGLMISSSPDLMSRRADFADLHLVTSKPVIYVFNCDESVLRDPGERSRLTALVQPAEALFLDAQMEAEMTGLDPEDRAELLVIVGQAEPGLRAVIDAAHRTLGLQSFLTANPREARAWTIRNGATALEAAGAIHTDFQRGFIAAEAISFSQLLSAGSWAAAKARGMVRTEGKAYLMQPDDVVEFRFNV